MNAFLIFHSTVKDPARFKAYAEAVGPTLAPFGGTVLLKGKAVEVLDGRHDHQAVGILGFADRAAAKAWYGSDAYRALIANRDEAADIAVVCYDAPPA